MEGISIMSMPPARNGLMDLCMYAGDIIVRRADKGGSIGYPLPTQHVPITSICESGQRVLTCGSPHMNRSRDTSSLAVLFMSLTTCLLTR